MKHLICTATLCLLAATLLADEPLITCTPQELRGIPGEPLQLKLTVKTDRANPIQLQIPTLTNLFLRTVEKIPIQRTKDGHYIQKRLIIWQGLEAGSINLTNLTIVLQDSKTNAPSVKISIDTVEPATPPQEEKNKQ